MQHSTASTDCSHHDEVTGTDSFPFLFSANQGFQCFCVCIIMESKAVSKFKLFHFCFDYIFFSVLKV